MEGKVTKKGFHGYALRSGIQLASVAALLAFQIVAVTGCGKKAPVRIDPAVTENIDAKAMPDVRPLRVALGAVHTPSEGFTYYKRLLSYVGTRLGQRIECLEGINYTGVNSMLKSGEVDMAFVCSGPYVDGKEEFGLELLVAPQMHGKAEYYSYIIVPLENSATRLADLKGKTFAFSDPLSNTGKLAPAYALSLQRETPDTFFTKYIYTHAHDKTLKLVAGGVVDGGAVDSLVWEYGKQKNSKCISRTRVIERLGPYGIPPVVVRKEMDPATKAKLRKIFLTAHEDKTGAKVLAGMMIDRFIEPDDKIYDSIRQMKTALAQQPNGQ